MELNKQDIEYIRQVLIYDSRKSFWMFCKTLEPDFYTDNKIYLHELCDTLQALYEGRIIKYNTHDEWRIADTLDGLSEHIKCNKFIMNLPPQTGKSRTLVNFCKWCFGKNIKERVITWSYNDETASDFSRYARDGIKQKKEFPYEIDYSDIFPDTKLKQGNEGFEKWALYGSHFSYIGAGLNGSITGKSGTIRICDDLIKDSTEALNDDRLEWIWKKYTDTFLSRISGHYIDIVNMTRWSSKDVVGRLLKDHPNDWYVFKREAYNKDTDTMLCPELLSKKDYEYIKSIMSPEIFYANYHQQPIDIQGKLYKILKEYELRYQNNIAYGVRTNPDTKETQVIQFENIIAYCDTADTGNDFLCCIVAGVYKGELFVIDVLYTKDGMEITEPDTARLLYKNQVINCLIESNNGGRGFARNVIRLLWDNHRSRRTIIKWFHQSKNKIARILTMSSFIQEHVYFPIGWDQKYPDFYETLNSYQKEGKNKNDDAPDCLTGLCEMQQTNGNSRVINIRR